MEAFNRDTDKYNADAYNRVEAQYANDYNRQREFNAQMRFNAAREKAQDRANWYNSLYGNIGQLASAISEIGRENA